MFFGIIAITLGYYVICKLCGRQRFYIQKKESNKKQNVRKTIGSFTTQQKQAERSSKLGAILTDDPSYKTEIGHIGCCELDSHTDTCVAGSNFLICELTGESADVHPYTTEYKPVKDVPIVTAYTAWTDQE